MMLSLRVLRCKGIIMFRPQIVPCGKPPSRVFTSLVVVVHGLENP